MSDEKIINIEKFKPKQVDYFTKEEMPFTLVCNKVINECQNPVAGFIWIYLQSKPTTWKPCKWEIMKRFNISESTYKRHIKYLTTTKLIETWMIRDEKGKIVDWRIRVLNGSHFNPSLDSYKGTSFLVITNQSVKNDTVENPAPDMGYDQSVTDDLLASSSRVSKPPGVDDLNLHINTRSTSLVKKEKDIINTSTEVEDYLVSFEKFYSVYPRKKGKQDAIKWFKKTKPTDEFVSMLMDDVNKRVRTEWNGKEPQYLPYPATYLNGKRWEDEIETSQPLKPKYPTPDERAEEQQKILAREMKAQLERQKEIEQTKGGVTKLIKGVDLKAMRAQQEAERLKLNMSVTEYHTYVISKPNNGAV